MLDPSPAWAFDSTKPLTKWYDHVHLLADCVVGQWFCLDRQTGAVRWERSLQPDEILDITDGVIIANQRRRQHIGSLRYGCYGISLDTGKLLWTSHSSGFWGTLRRLVGWTDCPVYVAEQQVFCRSGRVLDVKTGRLLERIPKGSVEQKQSTESTTIILGRSKSLNDPVRLQVSEGLWLSHKLEANEKFDPRSDEFHRSVWEFRLFLTDDGGEIRWTFDLGDTGYEDCYCPYEEKVRYSFPYIYLLVCEKRTTRREKDLEVYNPSQFHVLTLDVNTGQITQDIRVFGEPKVQCRLEAIDDSSVLLSDSDRSLLCYERDRVGHLL